MRQLPRNIVPIATTRSGGSLSPLIVSVGRVPVDCCLLWLYPVNPVLLVCMGGVLSVSTGSDVGPQTNS